MSEEYGLTPKGPNIKRLDVILDEMHNDLTEAWGVNTRQNPQSLVNFLLTTIADQIAELWEVAENIYYSQYPSSAEGINLDNVAQYGGSIRQTATRSFYPIHCTGVDGTRLETGTTIASTTNPKTYLALTDNKEITRSSFNRATIKVVNAVSSTNYTVAINGTSYTFRSTSSNATDILNGLATAITDTKYTVTVDTLNNVLSLVNNDVSESAVLILSANLTTDTVTTIISFGTVDKGDILLPENAITDIVHADAGLIEVVNLCGYVPGNDEETDAEFRKSYADKIFNRSSMMLESIRSAIINNVQGVISVATYENTDDEEDDLGRPPHSIEIVVDGGDNIEIAQQILNSKAGGISTFGSVEVVLGGLYDEDIVVRFNRPAYQYVWFNITLTLRGDGSDLPSDYEELIKNVVTENINSLNAGDDVVPQEFVSELYKVCTGIAYIDISMFSSDDEDDTPEEYDERTVDIVARNKAFTSADMIEVNIDE